MANLGRVIQALILFSTILGVVFLIQAYPLLPPAAFYFVTFGWILFVVDSLLTFVKPKVSYYLGLLLAVLALGETLSQPEHYSLVSNGNLPATLTLVFGSAAQALLIVFIGYYLLTSRKGDPWAWPGAESQA